MYDSLEPHIIVGIGFVKRRYHNPQFVNVTRKLNDPATASCPYSQMIDWKVTLTHHYFYLPEPLFILSDYFNDFTGIYKYLFMFLIKINQFQS